MKKIKCPHCGEEFAPTRSGYDLIVQQVRSAEYQSEIESYKKAIDDEKSLAIKEAETRIMQTFRLRVSRLEEALQQLKYDSKERLHEQEESYRRKLKEKDDEIAALRDFRARQSTKMIGENLEVHCEAEFNRLRAAGFPNAYFEKDNDVKTGSKGDYIYREFDESGVEILSIMFEMKNESDTTSAKKKNEDFFKELDKDRRQKKCEYAVLVSMLEFDNDFYNAGIADVSYRFSKMYVVRPQCFITIISILRSAALNALNYKKELSLIKGRNVDMATFELEMEEFKTKFGRNFRIANEKFTSAIEEIDKTIVRLQKAKADLMSSGNNLRLANEKAQALTIEKLTKPKKPKNRTAK